MTYTTHNHTVFKCSGVYYISIHDTEMMTRNDDSVRCSVYHSFSLPSVHNVSAYIRSVTVWYTIHPYYLQVQAHHLLNTREFTNFMRQIKLKTGVCVVTSVHAVKWNGDPSNKDSP